MTRERQVEQKIVIKESQGQWHHILQDEDEHLGNLSQSGKESKHGKKTR